jgi:hypothetical protein
MDDVGAHEKSPVVTGDASVLAPSPVTPTGLPQGRSGRKFSGRISAMFRAVRRAAGSQRADFAVISMRDAGKKTKASARLRGPEPLFARRRDQGFAAPATPT